MQSFPGPPWPRSSAVFLAVALSPPSHIRLPGGTYMNFREMRLRPEGAGATEIGTVRGGRKDRDDGNGTGSRLVPPVPPLLLMLLSLRPAVTSSGDSQPLRPPVSPPPSPPTLSSFLPRSASASILSPPVRRYRFSLFPPTRAANAHAPRMDRSVFQ